MADEIIPPAGAKVTVLRPPKRKGPPQPAASWAAWALPRAREADYLRTLQEWGGLPEVLSVPNAFRLLQALTRQNPAALARVLEEAIAGGEIKIWGLGPGGADGDREDWRENYIRVMHWVQPSSITKTGEAGNEVYNIPLVYDGTQPLHLEATGIRPKDAIALLRARGRKVPPELLGLLSELGLEDAPGPTYATDEGGVVKWTPERLAAMKAYRTAHGTKKTAEKFGLSEARVRKLLPGEKTQPTGYSAFTHRSK